MTGAATKEVVETEKIKLKGDIIDRLWYKKILMPDGKPDLRAIVILADLVWYYRAIDKPGKRGGIGLVKKFDGDILQRDYRQLTEKFGLTRQQIKNAIVNLKRLGLIKVELRTIKNPGYRPLNNVMHIRLVPTAVAKICYIYNAKEIGDFE